MGKGKCCRTKRTKKIHDFDFMSILLISCLLSVYFFTEKKKKKLRKKKEL